MREEQHAPEIVTTPLDELIAVVKHSGAKSQLSMAQFITSDDDSITIRARGPENEMQLHRCLENVIRPFLRGKELMIVK
jgi:hypothetical protein